MLLTKRIFILVVISLSCALAAGLWRASDLAQRNIQRQLLADTYIQGSDGHVGTAINLLTRGSFFGTPDNPFFGLVPRSLIYSALVALGFLLFGIHIWVPWLMNLVFYCVSVLLLYCVARRLLIERYAFISAVVLACFWGVFQFVWIINTEMFVLSLILLFILSLMKYRETEFLLWMIIVGVSLAALIETKAILYYFTFIALGLLFYAFLAGVYKKRQWLHYGVFAVLLLGIVIGFRLLNYVHLGSMDFSRGGHQFLVHAKSAQFTGEKMKAFLIGQVFGDFLTDIVSPGFANNPEPLGIVRQVANRWYEDRIHYVPELHTDQTFWEEGKAIALEHPVRFLMVAPFWFIRLNGPVHYNLAAIDHLFVGTRDFIPFFAKVGILLGIRIVWYGLMAIIFLQIYRSSKKVLREHHFDEMAWIILLTLYVNAMYSLFTTTEVRYILPVVPFYCLFFALWLQERKAPQK